ncbi:3'-5' exonuclease [Massilia sp. TS11]|uniref:3'-5' exonuclease n=1 Tax=Massilia sp. TS11 TaxID=2908003 RepID=UPI001EDC6F94|nr:3'-5' exonuclease [Massilia sp. TS11]MCG2584400.1 3'-5' exonuclease domain-containing protein 2 [Massilia sp. TS11]
MIDIDFDSLPDYQGLDLAHCHLIKTPAQAAAALAELGARDAIGFDTESKPTFTKGEASTGPHLVQLATDEACYLFQVGSGPSPDWLRQLLESPDIVKVGFGLDDDIKRLRSKLGIECQNVTDLAVKLRPDKRSLLGAKVAVARFFGQHMQKSKKITTTNWALPVLSDKQILYAADDAHVALRVYRHWQATRS